MDNTELILTGQITDELIILGSHYFKPEFINYFQVTDGTLAEDSDVLERDANKKRYKAMTEKTKALEEETKLLVEENKRREEKMKQVGESND